MPILNASNITYQHDNGRVLFDNISFTLAKRRVGLVGKNGVGKSLLASILAGQTAPTKGTVSTTNSLAYFHQQSEVLDDDTYTVAHFLDSFDVLNAIECIEKGNCSPLLFDLVGEAWDLKSKLSQQLKDIGLPDNPFLPCKQLSGGQLTKLRLWKTFNSNAALLILDEPSNHLDSDSKEWLSTRIRQYSGHVLIISHDRMLLDDVEEIWALSNIGMKIYGGNYNTYLNQLTIEKQATERQLTAVVKQKRTIEQQSQKNIEKAARRASQGSRLRHSGSQAKVLLDKKKDNATARAASRVKNEQQRQNQINKRELELKSKQQQNTLQSIVLAGNQTKANRVISLIEGVLPRGSSLPITLFINANEKVHLKGRNGVGKSTLLKTIIKACTLKSGELTTNTPLFYVDQHFSLVQPNLSVLDNIVTQCASLSAVKARTLLAGIGIRNDKVFQNARTLSGGEKMKVAMLIAANQPTLPMLLLDEPDNHLDIDAKSILANALNLYQGGFMLVTHDEGFSIECNLTKTVMLEYS